MVAPRIYGICATAAPVVGLLVRTSSWHLAARWDLDTGKVALGQWLRGNIYARRCDVSPDGSFLYTFAMKSGKPYHAVSRLPWLKALAFWRDNTTYTNGSHFEHIPARGGPKTTFGVPHDGTIEPLHKRHRLALVGNPTQLFGVELRRGWIEHELCPPRKRNDVWDAQREQILCRKRPGGGMRLVLVDHGATHALGAICGRRPTYYLEAATVQTPLPDVTWADWDAGGRLLVATSAGAVEIRGADSGRIIAAHSFAGLVPDPRPAPRTALAW